jgi:RNA polymerase sigma factor (sigma-70 family)
MQALEDLGGGGRDRRSLLRADDLTLVAIVRTGDTEAYGVLFERHWPAMRAIAARHCANQADVEDVALMAFTRTLRSIQRGRGPTTSLRAYLIATTARVAADRHRARRLREICVEQLPECLDHEGFARDDAADTHVGQALAGLPASWQHILWETCVEGRPVQEIAEQLGVRANTAAAMAYRARLGLREAYDRTIAAAAEAGDD